LCTVLLVCASEADGGSRSLAENHQRERCRYGGDWRLPKGLIQRTQDFDTRRHKDPGPHVSKNLEVESIGWRAKKEVSSQRLLLIITYSTLRTMTEVAENEAQQPFSRKIIESTRGLRQFSMNQQNSVTFKAQVRRAVVFLTEIEALPTAHRTRQSNAATKKKQEEIDAAQKAKDEAEVQKRQKEQQLQELDRKKRAVENESPNIADAAESKKLKRNDTEQLGYATTPRKKHKASGEKWKLPMRKGKYIVYDEPGDC
jgi:hypothetical protein